MWLWLWFVWLRRHIIAERGILEQRKWGTFKTVLTWTTDRSVLVPIDTGNLQIKLIWMQRSSSPCSFAQQRYGYRLVANFLQNFTRAIPPHQQGRIYPVAIHVSACDRAQKKVPIHYIYKKNVSVCDEREMTCHAWLQKYTNALICAENFHQIHPLHVHAEVSTARSRLFRHRPHLQKRLRTVLMCPCIYFQDEQQEVLRMWGCQKGNRRSDFLCATPNIKSATITSL